MISETYNIDCIEYMQGIEDNYFDLAIVDPPYGINRSGQIETFTKDPKHKRKYFEDKKWDNYTPNEIYFKQLFRVSKNQIIWGLIILLNIYQVLWGGFFGIKVKI